MKTFEIEIKEVLSRVININAENSMEAVSIVEELYNKEEIVLDYNDLKNKEIILYKYNEDKDFLIKEVIDYLFEDEKKHFEEYEESENHIYLKLLKLKSIIN